MVLGARSERRAREFVRSTFGRYLTEQVVQQLLDSPDGLKLGGQRDFVTIMMTDLRGFTSMCGTMEPEDVVRLLVDGFFPNCDATAKPTKARGSGFRELGLPYEADAAVTKHLAAFLSSHGVVGEVTSGSSRPLHVLFNGGVFKADALRHRVLDALGAWTAGRRPTQPLAANPDLDCAVARGAHRGRVCAHHDEGRHCTGSRQRGHCGHGSPTCCHRHRPRGRRRLTDRLPGRRFDACRRRPR
jgi:class 3 adenylate cyclase